MRCFAFSRNASALSLRTSASSTCFIAFYEVGVLAGFLAIP
jgi:hypothetical protein